MNKNNQNYLVDKRGNEVVQKMYNILQYPMPKDRLTAQSQAQTKQTDVIVNTKDFPNFKIIWLELFPTLWGKSSWGLLSAI